MANVYAEKYLLTLTKNPGGNITNRRFVKESGALDVVICSAVGESLLGVLVASGDVTAASITQLIVTNGIVLVEAGAAVTVGDWVTTDNVGRAITHVTATHATSCGRALNAATAAGEFIAVLLNIVPEEAT